jgi:hypothetical protein
LAVVGRAPWPARGPLPPLLTHKLKHMPPQTQLALTRLVSSQLFGITPFDPLTFAVAVLVLLTAALAASYFPRAGRLASARCLLCVMNNLESGPPA